MAGVAAPSPLAEQPPDAPPLDEPPPAASPLGEKPPLPTPDLDDDALSAFDRLPDEIIEQILQLTEPNSFASLVLLNAKWRRISQQAHLYAHHLSRCESYASSHPAINTESISHDDLPRLRRLFAREIKRNLFEAYLRPSATTVKLINTSISSSSAPGGEGMQFSPSARGHHVLAYNSSRIYVLDVREPELAVTRELKIFRRPAAACILDNGSLLAVLSTDMQVDVYDLGHSPPRRKQSLILDNPPRAIALSPCGSVLAAAYEGGIEVSSINPGALSTDRRAVKCDGVDSLAFSLDGTQLLGTTTTSSIPNTVILTAPYYDPGSQMPDDDISALWTTSILFPNTSRDCSHAVLLQESSSVEATWTFTYDRSFETFRAVRIDDLRNGTTYFTGPIPTADSPGPLIPCTLPSANYQGDLVSAGFQGKDVWLYGVPEDLEAVPEGNLAASDPSAVSPLQRRSSGISVRSPARIQETGDFRVPQWQILCDKFRNTFVSGRKITELSGVNNVKWVSGFGTASFQERLVITARGVQPPRLITEEEGIDFVDGGRVILLDFDYDPDNGKEREITIEVGTNEPEVLEEEHRDIDTEVAIVRRRTVAQLRGNRGSVARAATTTTRSVDNLRRPSTAHGPALGPGLDDPLVPRPMMTARNNAPGSTPDEFEDASLEEAAEALDAPYAHASPRSGTTLRRAATAAAMSRQRNPPTPVAGRVENRRADGRAEHPHESDADNWVPPPPPYQKDDPGPDLPAFLRHSLVPGTGLATADQPSIAAVPPILPIPPPSLPAPNPHGTLAPSRPELPKLQTSSTVDGQPPQLWNPIGVTQRATSIPASAPGPSANPELESQRPTSYMPQVPARYLPDDDDDIYDVSPIGSPTRAASSHTLNNQMADRTPERPSAGTQSSATEYTPASSRSYAPTDCSQPGSAHPPVTLGDPALPIPVDLPPPIPSSGHTRGSPAFRRLSNAFTWPKAPQVPPPATTSLLAGYPRSAPAMNVNNDEVIAASLPPAPRPDQLARLHNRQDSTGPPRPASGSFQFPRVPVGSRTGYTRASQRFSSLPERRPPSPPEQPLIISTPTGVSGAFDVPDTSGPANVPVEPVIHAPVPRHPRPASVSHLLRPPVERLDTISSVGPSGESQVPSVPGLPPNQLTTPSLRHHVSLNRRQSRARKGALKNIADAKERGWTGRKKNRRKGKDADGGPNGTGWADISGSANPPKGPTKERKCAVM
ncbi:hypothetical protein GGR56DRAFT_684928 [Xylariaceae sp. FL0804]|nr:hypothetical protein GGR56DRAFT_684928 [Xylariaceae sp. FL0804]